MCFDFTLVTSPHGSSLSLPTTPLPLILVATDDLNNLFEPYTTYTSTWPDEGGPDYAIQFGEVIDGFATVRVAAMNYIEQSWCHATLDTIVAVDEYGAFQIPGVPWRGLGTGRTDPVHGSELQNLLVEPFTISGYLAPDGQNAIVTLDDVLLDYRLAGKGCDLHDLDVFNFMCPDGEICCMDMSTGPTITEPSSITSIEYIAQDNCHARCPTSADNPDCTLP
ncbi:hypothetical protein L6R49_17300 [Myxococcota bacterium]|nr:hypothetical protein [Myxococcota bacterium]